MGNIYLIDIPLDIQRISGDILPREKRVLVSFTPEQWKLIESVKGEMGRGDADAVRTIVVSWLIEKDIAIQSIMNKVGKASERRDSR